MAATELKLTGDQKFMRERVYWLLLNDLLAMSKSTRLDVVSNKVRKLSDAALKAATKIAKENF
jgi:hypothetical protein